MARRDVVVIGASAGGVEALRELVSLLPADFRACVLVVLHVPATGSSALPHILRRAGRLRVKHAEDGDPLRSGVVLVAPPDRHLLVVGDEARLSRGPKENGYRPAVDVLFRSAANSLGARVIGVVLSGALDDGAAGMVAVKIRGGTCIVQDPGEALHGSMPRAAMAVTEVDHVLPVAKIADILLDLVAQQAPEDEPASALMEMETAMAEMDLDAVTDRDPPGEPSGWTCPDCHGSLFGIKEGGLLRFRCRVGHAWSPDSLVAEQTSSVETALWVALRTLDEKVGLTLDLARRASERGHRLSGEQFERQSEEARRSAAVLRSLIENVTDVETLARPAEASGAE